MVGRVNRRNHVWVSFLLMHREQIIKVLLFSFFNWNLLWLVITGLATISRPFIVIYHSNICTFVFYC